MDVDLSMSSAPASRCGWYPVTPSASLYILLYILILLLL